MKTKTKIRTLSILDFLSHLTARVILIILITVVFNILLKEIFLLEVVTMEEKIILTASFIISLFLNFRCISITSPYEDELKDLKEKTEKQ